MPILPKVGRKNWRFRLLVTLMHCALILGAATMVYPFLLMLGVSISSGADSTEFRVVPRYLYQEAPLFAKYVDDKYAGDLDAVNAIYQTDFKKIIEIAPRQEATPQDIAQAEEWRRFVKELPLSMKKAGFEGYGQHTGRMVLAYRAHLRRLFRDDILALNRAYIEEHRSFDTVVPPFERMTARNWNYDASQKTKDFLEWKRRLPDEWLLPMGLEPLFARYLKDDAPSYGGDIRKAAAVWGGAKSFQEIPLSAAPPVSPQQRRDWEAFVRNVAPFRYIRVLPAAVVSYRAYLKRRYPALERLNAAYGTRYASFEAVALPQELPAGGGIVSDWGEYLAKYAPAEILRLDTPEIRFRERLAKTGVQAEAVSPPYHLADTLTVRARASELRRDYVMRNYRLVIDYVILHGRALWVTVLFCLAMILTTLTVNPLCAYALSRYRLPYAYNILLFLLATMAFPAEVAMIPNFLLLKELGLLNTYWALVLPGAASGFSIFLLKGFFDSLPAELYEAGMIDGASELRMFWKITLPLARPIFAVIALEAFTAAYGAFMFALIICQNSKMWTIMVWLYQLQINSPQYVTMAALTVASLPTLLVFIFAQNVILRGIILPTEK